MTERNVKVCGSWVWPGSADSMGYQATNYTHFFPAENRKPCMFNIPGFPSAFL